MFLVLYCARETLCSHGSITDELRKNALVLSPALCHLQVPKRYYFTRQVALGSHRNVIAQYSLPQRMYLGPTSMDTEMAFIMCNQGKASRWPVFHCNPEETICLPSYKRCMTSCALRLLLLPLRAVSNKTSLLHGSFCRISGWWTWCHKRSFRAAGQEGEPGV